MKPKIIHIISIFSLGLVVACQTNKLPRDRRLTSLNDTFGCMTGLNVENPAKETCFQNVNGFALVDGDINLGKIDDLLNGPSPTPTPTERANTRGLLLSTNRGNAARWPGGIVYYQFTNGVPTSLRRRVETAVNIYNTKTVVKFIPITSTTPKPNNAPYMEINVAGRRDGNCFIGELVAGTAHIGALFPNSVCLSDSANSGVILHELGHVLGFPHEQQRPDREEFLTIYTRPSGAVRCTDFTTNNTAYTGGAEALGPYDFASVMHYAVADYLIPDCTNSRPNTFAAVHMAQKSGLAQGSYNGRFGQGLRNLSPVDIDKINLVYGGHYLEAPQTLKVDRITPTSVLLSYSMPTDSHPNVELEYSIGTSNQWTRNLQAVASSGSQSILVSSLNSGTEYHFRMRATAILNGNSLVSQYTREVVGMTLSSRRSYTLGGVASGIEGTVQLRLAINANGNAPYEPANFTITVNGDNNTFSFPTPIEEGAPYTLSVGPVSSTHKICSLALPTTLVMPSSNSLNDISLSCTNRTYRVSGLVSFPLGNTSPLTVSNGSEAVVVNPGGGRSKAFNFANSIEYGMTLNITIQDSVANRTCTVPTGFTVGENGNTINIQCRNN